MSLLLHTAFYAGLTDPASKFRTIFWPGVFSLVIFGVPLGKADFYFAATNHLHHETGSCSERRLSGSQWPRRPRPLARPSWGGRRRPRRKTESRSGNLFGALFVFVFLLPFLSFFIDGFPFGTKKLIHWHEIQLFLFAALFRTHLNYTSPRMIKIGSGG